MSILRLVLIDKKSALSGLIPSAAMGTLFLSLSESSGTSADFWKKCKNNDPGLEKHFRDFQDVHPIMEGAGDGLLILDIAKKRIESFQEYQRIKRHGRIQKHDGQKSDPQDVSDYEIPGNWEIIDHIFEEK
ncbi:MAG: hypothetical protein HQM10_17495 [Candidatus Riflebacteria bacterium]|nr:hypothetical protein [Candidatus Riflebacteria bacterium]